MKMKLTEARIPSLRTLKPQEDVFHEPTPGAGLRVTRKGRKTWFLLYSAPGSKQLRRVYFGETAAGATGSLASGDPLPVSSTTSPRLRSTSARSRAGQHRHLARPAILLLLLVIRITKPTPLELTGSREGALGGGAGGAEGVSPTSGDLDRAEELGADLDDLDQPASPASTAPTITASRTSSSGSGRDHQPLSP